MFITSIGIFGFLSRAHIEQTAGIGSVSTQIEQLNLDIRLEQDTIDNNRKIITQLDAAVNNLLQGSATQSQQTRANSAQQASNLATQATRLRQQQNLERTRLQTEITASSNRIADLNRQKLQFEQQIRNIETEVGPIKYNAQFVYGNEARDNKELLEKSVTWLILIIIFVFDPLAVLLLIASQISFHNALQARQARKLAKEAKKQKSEPQLSVPMPQPAIIPETIHAPIIPEPAVETAAVPAKILNPFPKLRKRKKATIVESVEKPVEQEAPVPAQPPKKKESYIMRKGDQQIKVDKKSQ
jgi:hypothetical protein